MLFVEEWELNNMAYIFKTENCLRQQNSLVNTVKFVFFFSCTTFALDCAIDP